MPFNGCYIMSCGFNSRIMPNLLFIYVFILQWLWITLNKRGRESDSQQVCDWKGCGWWRKTNKQTNKRDASFGTRPTLQNKTQCEAQIKTKVLKFLKRDILHTFTPHPFFVPSFQPALIIELQRAKLSPLIGVNRWGRRKCRVHVGCFDTKSHLLCSQLRRPRGSQKKTLCFWPFVLTKKLGVAFSRWNPITGFLIVCHERLAGTRVCLVCCFFFKGTVQS